MSRTMSVVCLAVGLLAGGCYSTAFTQTAQYPVQERTPDAVQVMTSKPASGYREVGIISANGSSFEAALERARGEAATHGCEVVAVIGETVESGKGVPGSAYGMTRNDLRCSCLVRLADQPAKAN
jgi:hypothetical protein